MPRGTHPHGELGQTDIWPEHACSEDASLDRLRIDPVERGQNFGDLIKTPGRYSSEYWLPIERPIGLSGS